MPVRAPCAHLAVYLVGLRSPEERFSALCEWVVCGMQHGFKSTPGDYRPVRSTPSVNSSNRDNSIWMDSVLLLPVGILVPWGTVRVDMGVCDSVSGFA